MIGNIPRLTQLPGLLLSNPRVTVDSGGVGVARQVHRVSVLAHHTVHLVLIIAFYSMEGKARFCLKLIMFRCFESENENDGLSELSSYRHLEIIVVYPRYFPHYFPRWFEHSLLNLEFVISSVVYTIQSCDIYGSFVILINFRIIGFPSSAVNIRRK